MEAEVPGISKKKIIIWGSAVIAALLLLLIVIQVWKVGKPAWSLYQTAQTVQQIRQNPSALKDEDLAALMSQTRQDLTDLRNALHPYYGLMRRLNWLPRYGGEISAGPELLEMAVALSQVGDIGLNAIAPALPAVLNRDETETGADELIALAVKSLAESPADFENAQQSLKQAETFRAEIKAENLSAPGATALALLDENLPLLKLGLTIAPALPNLLGAEQAKTYLIVAQNDDELRATGGFITAVGSLTLKQGQVISLTFEDSYAVDVYSNPYPEAPAPLARYMMAPFWIFRDGNWSPDFPASAQDMLSLYAVSRPEAQFDGIIAVDQAAMQQLVQALEPVKIPGWEEPATGDNVIRLIRETWSPETGDGLKEKGWWKNRKNFISDLVSAMRQRIETEPDSVNWKALIAALLNTLDERHIQIWLKDEAAQNIITAQGWDGAIKKTSGDYLLVVDSNVGFNKVNAAAETSLAYEVQLQEDGPSTATLSVSQQNKGKGKEPCLHKPYYGANYSEMINRCYWDYLRVYVPAGSELLKATPHAIPAKQMLNGRREPARVVDLPSEADKSVWGTLVLIPQQKTITTTFQYTLPDTVLTQTETGLNYQLYLQKQAGTKHNAVTVIITPPNKRKLLSAVPPPSNILNDGRLAFELTLHTDQQLDLNFE